MTEVLVIFAKAPRAGRVKTRLVPPLSPAQAAAVHTASLHDVVAIATSAFGDPRIFHDDGEDARTYFADAFPRLSLAVQCSGNLGRRLADAFQRMFAEGAERVAIIGADSPTLPAKHISDGLAAVREHDLALGPSVDGGYYLVALRREAWPGARIIFDAIPWSTDRVLAMTRSRAEAAGFRPLLLEPWYDIDRIEDLRLARTQALAESHLGQLLSRSGLGGDV